MLKYVVKIGWRCEFMFNDMVDAGTFAAQAANHKTDNSDKDEITITIVNDDAKEEDDD